MGGSPSKQSSEVERNRRLREFEEELIDPDNHVPHILQGQYFHQFLGEDSNPDRTNRESNGGGGVDVDVNDILSDPDGLVKRPEVGIELPPNDKEVEDAIAELEETFRTLSPPLGKDGRTTSGYSDDLSRSKSCGPLNPYPASSNSNNSHLLPVPGGSRIGTPMRGSGGGSTNVVPIPQNPGQNHRRHHRRQMMGGARSSGGLLSGGGGGSGSGGLESSKSAPPWAGVDTGSLPVTQQWTPPTIQGFDVDKFREVNQRTGTGSGSGGGSGLEKRLPGTITSTTISSPHRGDPDDEDHFKDNKRPPTPYTTDELELLKKLEREVY